MIGSQTLPSGGGVTVGRQTLSLAANGSGIVVVGGSTTTTLAPAQYTGGVGKSFNDAELSRFWWMGFGAVVWLLM